MKANLNQVFGKTLAAGFVMTLLWALIPCAVSLYILSASDASAARIIGSVLASVIFGFAMAATTGHFDVDQFSRSKKA